MVLRRAGLDAEEVVEGDILALCFGDFVTDTEDFVVWSKQSENVYAGHERVGSICGLDEVIGDGYGCN